MQKWMLILSLLLLTMAGCELIERPETIVVITDTPVVPTEMPTETPTPLPTDTPTTTPTLVPTDTPIPTATPTATPTLTTTASLGPIDPAFLTLTPDDLNGLFFPVSLDAFGLEEPLVVDGISFDGAFVLTDPGLNFYLGFSNVVSEPSEAEAFDEVMSAPEALAEQIAASLAGANADEITLERLPETETEGIGDEAVGLTAELALEGIPSKADIVIFGRDDTIWAITATVTPVSGEPAYSAAELARLLDEKFVAGLAAEE